MRLSLSLHHREAFGTSEPFWRSYVILTEMNKNLKQKNQEYLVLSIWLLGGLSLVALNYIIIEFVKSVVSSEVFGWTVLFGGPIYLLAIIVMLIMADFLYLVLFLRRLFLGKNNRTKNTVYLP